MLPGEAVGGVDVAVAQDGLVGVPYRRSCCRSLESSAGLHESLESLFLTSLYTTETRPEWRRRDGVVPPTGKGHAGSTA
jgi:hypothetical protein